MNKSVYSNNLNNFFHIEQIAVQNEQEFKINETCFKYFLQNETFFLQ